MKKLRATTMRKQMTAKYAGRCAVSGAPIRKGDWITFDTVTRKAWFTEQGDCQVSFNDHTNRRAAWQHNAPYNAEFLGAQPAHAGQDY
jgi:hypothetical protein